MNRFLCVVVLLVLMVSCAQAEVFLAEAPAEWKGRETLAWTIFDMDEGDAMLLECGGESILVDGGPRPFRENLQKALEAQGLKHLTYVFSTHNHDDHMEGILHLFKSGFTAGEYLHGYSDIGIAQNDRAKKTVAAAQKAGVPVRRVGHGDTLAVGSAQFEVLHCTTVSGTNARSLVLRVDFKESSVLLCADITGAVQRHFLETVPEKLDVDLIKLPHHAITPTVPEFLDAVSADAYLITNRKSQLDSKSVNQMTARNKPAFYAGGGDVHAVTDGTDWYIWQDEAK